MLKNKEEKISRRLFIKTSATISVSTLISGSILSNCSKSSVKIDISVVEGENYFNNTVKAVEQIGGIKRFVPKNSKVAILANPQRNNPGTYTSPVVLSAVIRMCKQAGAKEVNCLTLQSERNWKNTGLKEVVDKEGATLILVDSKDESQFKRIPIPKGKALKEAIIMKKFFDNDIFINIPITKDHAGNKFTATLKNLMGLNGRKSNRTFHKKYWRTDINSITHLDQSIADLNTIITPDLCIVDATEFITTNGPFGPGKLLKPKRVVVGTDRVAIDSYCCKLWGLEPKNIIMINKAFEHKLGEIDPNKVKVKFLKV